MELLMDFIQFWMFCAFSADKQRWFISLRHERIAVSRGSACQSGMKPSHVLAEMLEWRFKPSLRISFSPISILKEDINVLIKREKRYKKSAEKQIFLIN
jgi:cysteine sulfinate desulfinase/cysteine desulfurase-like protein